MGVSVVGREAELVGIDAVLAAGRREFAVLVLEGEPGIGKTTVWREGIARATSLGYRVLSCRAASAEARLSFAALGDLLAQVDRAVFEALPDPQRRALDIALLRGEPEGAAPSPRAIGTGVVSLVSGLAAEGPVVLALDDVQWLDRPSARALAFLVRRLEDQPVVVLTTVRAGEGRSDEGLLAIVPDTRVHRVRLGPLSLAALYRIVAEEVGHGLPRPLLVRIERATGGNPFYALEIARSLEVEGDLAAGQALPVPDDLRQLAAARLGRLPRRAREALLRVSALTRPTVAVVDPADLAPAEEAGVVRVRFDGRIDFAHPLFAGAVYAAASLDRRRRLHGELADLASDVEERARHLTLASEGTDERIAAVLDAAAEHARRRGAPEVAAELEEQAAQRTPLEAEAARWQRWLRAGRNHLRAGDPARARELAEEVVAASPPRPVRAQALHLLAEVRAAESPEAAIPLLEEALACVGDDWRHAAQIEVALSFLLIAVLDLAQADRHLVRAVELTERAGDAGLLAEAVALNAVAALFLGRGVDESALARALALEDEDREVPLQMRPALNIAHVYKFTGRIDLARGLLVRLHDQVVGRGEETEVPWVLVHLAETSLLAGDFAEAEREADEALRTATLTGQEAFVAFALLLRSMVRAVRGDSLGARGDGIEALAIAERIGWPIGVHQSRYGLGFLALSEGDPRAAVDVLEPVVATIEALGVYEWPIAMSLPDAIEALVATGELDRAARLTDALAGCGRDFDRPWALATTGRCRALLQAAVGDLDSACAAAERALVEHERLAFPFELGRTVLVLGQLQRRRGERREARETLERALGIFDELGAPLWAEKARAEIRRIGVRRAPGELTEGEQRVAELAAQGLTNPEIAARLFVSRRTVEANLARAYRKLGIHSRAQLGATMAKRGAASS